MFAPDSQDTVAAEIDLFSRAVRLLQGLSDQDEKLIREVLTRPATSLRRVILVTGYDVEERPAILRKLLDAAACQGIECLAEAWKTGALIEYANTEGEPRFWRTRGDESTRLEVTPEEFREFAAPHQDTHDIYRMVVEGNFPRLRPGAIVMDTPAFDRTSAALADWPSRIEWGEVAAVVRVEGESLSGTLAQKVEAKLRQFEQIRPVYRVSDPSDEEFCELLARMQQVPPPPSPGDRRTALQQFLRSSAKPALQALKDRAAKRVVTATRQQRFEQEMRWYVESFRDASAELLLNEKRALKNDLRLELLSRPLIKTGLIFENRREALLHRYLATQFAPRLQLLIKRHARELARTIVRLDEGGLAKQPLDPGWDLWQQRLKDDWDLRLVTTSVLLAASPQLLAGGMSLFGLDQLAAPSLPLPAFPQWQSLAVDRGFLNFTGLPKLLDKFGEQISSQLTAVHGAVGTLATAVTQGVSLLLMQQALLGFGTALVSVVQVKEHFVLAEMEEKIEQALDELVDRLHETISEFERRLLTPPAAADIDQEHAQKAAALLREIEQLPTLASR